MRKLWLKLFRRNTMQQDLEAELAFHRAMSQASGNPLPVGPIREEAYDLWRFTSVENLWRDIAYAARGLRRNPTLVFTAVLSLALGIGVNTTMFSLGMEFLFSEPSVRDPGGVVSVQLGGNSHAKESVVNAVRDSGLFADVVGEHEETFLNWNDGVETHPVFGVFTTNNFFQALGVPMALGRGFLPSDPKEVAVLHHRFWTKQFNSDPAIVGKAINIDGRSYTVVGVLPADHRTLVGFGFSPDIYVPKYLADTYLAIYARLKPGMTYGQARAGLTAVAAGIDSAFPEDFKYAKNIRMTPLAGFARFQQEEMMTAVGVFFLLLLAVTGLVLLIACVNVASLLLARASARRAEIAVRLALGASRGRLLQQLLTESMLLALLGTAAGLALSQVTATMLGQIQLPLPFPVRLQISPDWRLALYAAFLTIGATAACGLLPAWQSVKNSISSDFHRDRRMTLRRVLVVSQVAFSLVVLFTAFLFLRNLLAARSISPGFDVRNTLRAEVHLPPDIYKDTRRKTLFVEQGLRELGAIPGITSVAAARILPFIDNTRFGSDLVFPDTKETVHAQFEWNAVTPAYFATMDIPIVQGRAFLPTDRGTERAVIVNRTFIERVLGKGPAVNRTFLWGPKGVIPYRIVGIAENTKNMSIGEDPMAQLYEPLAQIDNDRARLQFVMRSAIPPAAQLEAVRRVMHRLEPAAGTEVATLYSSIGFAFLPSQVGAVLMGSTGMLGLLLAAIGLYGVMVYSVSKRTREIGVRIAIGARPADIARMVLIDSAKLVAAGSVIGSAVAFFAAKPLATFLVPGLKPSDPLSFLAVVAVLALTGIVASWSPMRRAASIDPMTSLRQE